MLSVGAIAVRILYGVVGEGMGHATRSRVVLEHLLRAGHELRVVVSGRAHRFLTERLAGYQNLSIQEIHGLSLTTSATPWIVRGVCSRICARRPRASRRT